MNDILADMETENIYDSYEEARDEKEIAEARRKKRIRFVGIGIAFLVVLSLLVSGVGALCDNVQNHPSDNLTLYYENEICTTPWENTSTHNFVEGYSYVTIANIPYSDTKAIKFCAGISGSHNGAWGKATIKSTIPEVINYFSFTTRSNSNYIWISFYDSDNTLINTSNNLGSYISANDSCEFLKSGDSVALYVNGTYKCNIGGLYNRTPYYIELAGAYRTYFDHGIGSTYHYYDDFFTSSEEGIIGTIEHSSIVYRNVDNPASSIYFINTSYVWKTREAGISLDSADSLITKYATTGEVVNTTVPNASKPCGIIEYNISNMLYHDNWQDDNYGYYYQELKRGSEVLATDYFFYMYVVSGASTATINWDKDSYVSGQTAQINWSIADEDFTDYTYKGSVWSLTDPTTTKYTWSITTITGMKNVDLGGYETDTYFVVLTMRDKSTGHEYDIAGDIMALNEELMIAGITHNAGTEMVLVAVNVSFLQGTQFYNTTSDGANGEYNVSGLSVDIGTNVNATKTDYVHNDFSFTPLQTGLYKIDIFMLLDIDHISYHNTSIGGLVQSSPFYQIVSGATVNLWNASWNDSTTANSMGYYIFEELTNGTYSINATCAGYLASSNEEVETNNGSFLYHYILLEPQFILTIKASDASTHATIADFTAIVNDGTPQDTTNGSIGFIVGYGIQKVEASAEGYYASLEYVYVDEDTEEIMYLTPLEGASGTGLYYPPPHLVEFRVQNVWGKQFSDASVIAQGYEITHPTTWLGKLFGYENATEIYSEQMNGTTDSNGQLSFMMVETIKYQINVSDTESPARFDDKTFWIYPKDERYNLVVSGGITWQKAGTEEQKELSINVTTNIIDDTHAYINVSYNDPSNRTTNLTIYVNYTINNNEEECLNSSNWVNTSVQNYSYIVTPYKGHAFKIQVVTEHEGWGGKTWTYAKRFPGMLIDLGLPDVAYPMIAVAVLLFLGGVFGRSSATQGSLVICFGGWFFWAIGFLTMINSAVMLSALSLASVVSIIAIMMEKSRKTGVQ